MEMYLHSLFWYFILPVCVDTNYNTAAEDTAGLPLPWIPLQRPKLKVKVKNEGTIKITVMGETLPKLTAFIGIDPDLKYQGKFTEDHDDIEKSS